MWFVVIRFDSTQCDSTRFDCGVTRCWFRPIWFDCCVTRCWFGPICFGLIRLDVIRFDPVWFALIPVNSMLFNLLHVGYLFGLEPILIWSDSVRVCHSWFSLVWFNVGLTLTQNCHSWVSLVWFTLGLTLIQCLLLVRFNWVWFD